MRRYQIGLFALTAALTACHAEICDLATCNAAGGSGASGGGGGNPTTGGNGGEGGGLPASCDPSSPQWTPSTTCGVFVDAGASAGGTGSPESPFNTLADALATSPSRIYACASSTPLAEAVSITSSVTIIGGLDCATLELGSDKTSLNGPIDVPAISIAGATTAVSIDGFDIVAPAATVFGNSSIGIFVHEASLEIANSHVTAGDGAPGAAGSTPPPWTGAMPDGMPGSPGKSGGDGKVGCTSPLDVGAGAGDGIVCLDSDGQSLARSSQGGDGGKGTVNGGTVGDGDPGGSNPVTVPVAANGGKVQTTMMSCGQGQVGTAGAPGAGGPGASGRGQLLSTGYEGVAGTPGQDYGFPGQGGGGGGGARGDQSCALTSNAGYSGAAGGTGGCGGAPGPGGGYAGGSFAVAVLGGSLSLTTVGLSTGAGGLGGKGADGQAGGAPGLGGDPNIGGVACSGGDGGFGGKGGAGGGGLGGPSVAILLQDVTTMPDVATVTFEVGAAGMGGMPGGSGGNVGTVGANGDRCGLLDLTGASCTAP